MTLEPCTYAQARDAAKGISYLIATDHGWEIAVSVEPVAGRFLYSRRYWHAEWEIEAIYRIPEPTKD